MADSRPVCVVLGGGGHARVLVDVLEAVGVVVRAILDRDASKWNQQLQNIPILGPDALLRQLKVDGVTHFVVGVGSVGDSEIRERLFDVGVQERLAPLTVVHPSATCSRWAVLGEGTQVFPGAVVNAGARIGENVIINTGAIVEHDCEIGSHAHVATGARLCSGVRVGTGAHIGAGATIRQTLVVGERAVVGAGAVVVKDVGAGSVVVGVPARLLHSVTS